jgi:hypothetical protein
MDEMSAPITRGEFKAEMAAVESRFERRFEQLDHKLEMWGGALNAKIEALGAKFDSLQVDITRGLNAVIETLRSELRASAEPARDNPERIAKLEALPERVEKLEAAVFGPKP